MSKRRVHYVLSTHWDREWYQSLQDYRWRLVKMLDQVLAGLVDNRLKGPFQSDGQAIMWEDYLEMRPEQRPLVERLAREGKLVMGPWYVMPDEFLVSGEALVRNLRRGCQVARLLGGVPSSAGFVCDIFGHNSQLPQIFAGFGIHGAFVWRGTNHVSSRHLLWRGADGTELVCYRFGHRGYCSYCFAVRQAGEHRSSLDHARARRDLDAYIQSEAALTEADPVLLFDGGDHQGWDTEMYAILLERMQQTDSFEIVHTSLDAYLEELLPQRQQITCVVEGELREPGMHPAQKDEQWLIPGVLSSRVDLKQANAECQTLLCHWAEPFAAFAACALEWPYPQGFLDVAWKWLLQNHPHDSICGCSIDQVHRDMLYRFSQCRQIANRVTIEATRALAIAVEGRIQDGELRVVVFNPLPYEFHGVIDIPLQIPSDWPVFNEFFGFEPKPAFRIFDATGGELSYQRLAQAMNRTRFRTPETRFPEISKVHEVQVAMDLRLPGLGYSTLTVRRPDLQDSRPCTRHPNHDRLITSERSMANEFLAVEVESNGTLTLVDKRNGQTYRRLLTLEDSADIGDGWFHGVATNDQRFVSTASRCDVAVVQDGPLVACLRMRVAMHVPSQFCFDSMTRDQAMEELVVDNLITLRKGSTWVEVTSTVHNNAKDHRLRVLLPTGAQSQEYLADSVFDVVRRPITLRADGHLYRELEVETKPQQSWTAVCDGNRGLGVISSGLMESAVLDLPEHPLALTLFRSTRRTVMTDGEPDGQLNRILSFHYWIAPFAGPVDVEWFCRMGQRLAADWRCTQVNVEDQRGLGDCGHLPATGSLLDVEGPAVVSSVSQQGNRTEIRLFNPTTEHVQARLNLNRVGVMPRPWSAYQTGNLAGEGYADMQPITQGCIVAALKPKQVLTLLLKS